MLGVFGCRLPFLHLSSIHQQRDKVVCWWDSVGTGGNQAESVGPAFSG